MKISDMDVGMELLFMERVLGPQVGLRDDGLVADVALAAPIESPIYLVDAELVLRPNERPGGLGGHNRPWLWRARSGLKLDTRF